MKMAIKKSTAPVKSAGKKKKTRRKTRKKTAKKKTIKRGPAKRKVAKKAKRGRPPLKKTSRTGKKRGRRPGRKRATRRAAGTLKLSVTRQTDIDFWTKLISYLNKNKGKTFVIQLDGKDYSLSTV